MSDKKHAKIIETIQITGDIKLTSPLLIGDGEKNNGKRGKRSCWSSKGNGDMVLHIQLFCGSFYVFFMTWLARF